MDANFESEYEEGLLFTAHQILAELGEKFKGDIRNGMSGQIANDAHTQGVVALNSHWSFDSLRELSKVGDPPAPSVVYLLDNYPQNGIR